MYMERHEIVQMYKEAKDKNAQIEILADLNACKKEEILTVLQEEGLISGVKSSKKEQKPRLAKMQWTDEAKEKVRLLLSEGMTVLEVAERMGLDAVQVRNAVTRFKLRRKDERGKERHAQRTEKRMPIDCVSLIRDYAKCITLISPEEVQNYKEIVGAFAGSIIEAANGILEEAKKYAQ